MVFGDVVLRFWCSSDAKMTAVFGCFPVSCPMPLPLFSSSLFLLVWVAGTCLFFFVLLLLWFLQAHTAMTTGVAAGVWFSCHLVARVGTPPFCLFLCVSLFLSPSLSRMFRIQTDKQTWQRGMNLALGKVLNY